MKKNTIIKKIVFIFIALSAIVFSISMSINIITKDKNYYYEYSKKNNITEYTGLNADKLEDMYSNLIDYIYSGDESLINKDFNKREVAHMLDVHKLYNLNMLVTYITSAILIACIIYLVLSYKKKRNLYNELRYVRNAFLIILLAIIILVGIISIDFDSAFIKFHEIFFNNDLWLLNPKTDIMIRMLPQEFFMNMAIRIGKTLFTHLVVLFLIMNIFLKKNKDN
ncbi:MAG: TIGR01906 family membrane protein [Helcococcus sp.]|nr:TIGR01906 family membrane protein [Helcococcus sp.]